MNTRTHVASLSLLFLASFGLTEARAAESLIGHPGIVVNCANPTLPSQREVGEMMGQYNFSQVYATRVRLMAEARRACHRDNATQVRLVLEDQPAAPQADRQVVHNTERAN